MVDEVGSEIVVCFILPITWIVFFRSNFDEMFTIYSLI